MPYRDETLGTKTFKEDGIPVDKRVFYTLTKDTKVISESLVTGRNAKAIGLLFKTLIDSEILTEDQLDEILLEVIH